MIFFTTNASADCNGRIFIQNGGYPDETNEVVGLHEMAKELSVWKNADKNVTFPPQRDKSKPGLHMRFMTNVKLSGYVVEAEEMAVLVKRCTRRGLKDVTAELKDLEIIDEGRS